MRSTDALRSSLRLTPPSSDMKTRVTSDHTIAHFINGLLSHLLHCHKSNFTNDSNFKRVYMTHYLPYNHSGTWRLNVRDFKLVFFTRGPQVMLLFRCFRSLTVLVNSSVFMWKPLL